MIVKLFFLSSLYAPGSYFIKADLDFDHKLAFFENVTLLQMPFFSSPEKSCDRETAPVILLQLPDFHPE